MKQKILGFILFFIGLLIVLRSTYFIIPWPFHFWIGWGAHVAYRRFFDLIDIVENINEL